MCLIALVAIIYTYLQVKQVSNLLLLKGNVNLLLSMLHIWCYAINNSHGRITTVYLYSAFVREWLWKTSIGVH